MYHNYTVPWFLLMIINVLVHWRIELAPIIKVYIIDLNVYCMAILTDKKWSCSTFYETESQNCGTAPQKVEQELKAGYCSKYLEQLPKKLDRC